MANQLRSGAQGGLARTAANITTDPRQLEDMIQSLTQAASRPLKYNPEDDPRYQAARQLAEAEAGRASQAAMEELNVRGILPSTITADRLGQIRQQSAESVAGMIPGLYQAALQEQQQQFGNLGTALNAALSLQQATQSQEQARWERQYAQEQLGMERSRLAQSAASVSTRKPTTKQPTITEQTRDSLASVYEDIDRAIAGGATADVIRASIDSQYSDLVRIGIDPERVKDYLAGKVEAGIVAERAKTPAELEQERLQARPWWQRAIDILPGQQFR